MFPDETCQYQKQDEILECCQKVPEGCSSLELIRIIQIDNRQTDREVRVLGLVSLVGLVSIYVG